MDQEAETSFEDWGGDPPERGQEFSPNTDVGLERIIQREFAQDDAKQTMRDFDSEGMQQLLMNFVDRHQGSMTADTNQDLLVNIKRLARTVTTLKADYNFGNQEMVDEGYKLFRSIGRKVIYAVKASNRNRAAFQSKQQVPSNRQTDPEVVAQVAEDIKRELRETREYNLLQGMNMSAGSPEELSGTNLMLTLAQLERDEWESAEGKMRVDFQPEISEVSRKIQRLERKLDQLMRIEHGQAGGFGGQAGGQAGGFGGQAGGSLRLRGGTRAKQVARKPPEITEENYQEILALKDPDDIKDKLGYDVKGTVDLYRHFGYSGLEKVNSLRNVIKFLEHAAGFKIDDPLPESVLGVVMTARDQTKRRFRKGTTLRDILKQAGGFPAKGPIDWNKLNLADRSFDRLIGKGGLYKKAETAGSSLPSAVLINIFEAVKDAELLKGADALVNIHDLYTYKDIREKEPTEDMQKALDDLFVRRDRYQPKVQGRDRTAARTLIPFFRSKEVFTPAFFQLTVEEQYRKLKKIGGPVANPNTWRDALVQYFGFLSESIQDPTDPSKTVASPLPPLQKAIKNYTEQESLAMWTACSKELSALMKHSGSWNALTDQLMYHTAGLSRSEFAEGRDPTARMKRSRSREPESEADSPSQEDEKEAEAPPTKRAPASTPTTAAETMKFFEGYETIKQHIPNMNARPGLTLLVGFDKAFRQWAANGGKAVNSIKKYQTYLRSFKNQCFHQLNQAYGNVNRDTHVRFPFPRNHKGNNDALTQTMWFVKMGWNEYVSRLTPPPGKSLKDKMFENVPTVQKASNEDIPMFRPSDDAEGRLTDLLMSLAAADLLNRNLILTGTKPYGTGPVSIDESIKAGNIQHTNLKDLIEKSFEIDTYKRYEALAAESPDMLAGIPDWKDRITKYHQSDYLSRVLDGTRPGTALHAHRPWEDHITDIVSEMRGRHLVKTAPPPQKPAAQADLAKIRKAKRLAQLQKQVKSAQLQKSASISAISLNTGRPELEADGGSAKRQAPAADEIADEDIQDITVLRTDVDDYSDEDTYDRSTYNDARLTVENQIGRDAFRMMSSQDQQIAVHNEYETMREDKRKTDANHMSLDASGAAVDEAEEEAARAIGPNYDWVPDANRHRYGLRADVARSADQGVVAMHLLQTDHNVAPVMGRVHLVKADFGYADNHFMHDVEGDINEGQKTIVERFRRGPFRDQGGASTIMDHSRHIMYRKRDGCFEITIRRGATNSELQQMISKLSMHRTQQGGSRVTIIKGSRRYRLGNLTDLNLNRLLELVSECIDQYGICGLEIVERVPGSGPLYRGGMHTPHYKARTRRKKSVVHGRRRR